MCVRRHLRRLPAAAEKQEEETDNRLHLWKIRPNNSDFNRKAKKKKVKNTTTEQTPKSLSHLFSTT